MKIWHCKDRLQFMSFICIFNYRYIIIKSFLSTCIMYWKNGMAPRIDLSLVTIAALTIYMAYRSRRFIPIAGIAACPVIAMFINEMACTISASRNFYKRGLLAVPAMLRGLQVFFISVGIIVVVGLGAYWSLKFKYIYLDSWPPDTKLNSVFMRMTASHAKPFYTCEFIKGNKLEGKMFN